MSSMVLSGLRLLWQAVSPERLTGPVFEKELRVLSRRRRTYALRAGYLLALLVFILTAWLSWMATSRSAALLQTARMAEAGRLIIRTVMWFQFVAAQVVAVIMLSGSIGDEVRRGTLGVLMATPVTSLQLVTGKLLSCLLQIFLLMGVSLSTLSVVHVFGGIQWDYIIGGVGITLSASLFAGSVSLFLSIRSKRPYAVIVAVLILLVIEYGIVLVGYDVGRGSQGVMTILGLTNSFGAMRDIDAVVVRRITAVRGALEWWWHCVFMFGLSAAIIGAAVIRVRSAMSGRVSAGGAKRELPRAIRVVAGYFTGRRKDWAQWEGPEEVSAVLWKELGRGFWPPSGAEWKVFGLMMFGLVVSYQFWIFPMRQFGYVFIRVYSLGLVAVVSLRTAAMAAVSISGEREARTWGTLMGTALSDKAIVRDKALGVIARNRPGWAVLLLSPIISAAAYCIYVYTSGHGSDFRYVMLSVFRVPGLVAGVVAQMAVLVGAGMYLSMRLRSSTAAVIGTVLLALGGYFYNSFIYRMLVQIFFYRLVAGGMGWSMVLAVVDVFHSAFLGLVGILLLWRVKKGVRRRVFL